MNRDKRRNAPNRCCDRGDPRQSGKRVDSALLSQTRGDSCRFNKITPAARSRRAFRALISDSRLSARYRAAGMRAISLSMRDLAPTIRGSREGKRESFLPLQAGAMIQ